MTQRTSERGVRIRTEVGAVGWREALLLLAWLKKEGGTARTIRGEKSCCTVFLLGLEKDSSGRGGAWKLWDRSLDAVHKRTHDPRRRRMLKKGEGEGGSFASF